jgi:hypothetical protein
MLLHLQIGRHTTAQKIVKQKDEIVVEKHKIEVDDGEGNITWVDPEIPHAVTSLEYSKKEVAEFKLGRTPHPIPTFRVDGRQSFWFYPGVTVMFGQAGTGKTVTINYMREGLAREDHKSSLIRYGEPELTPVSEGVATLPLLRPQDLLLKIGQTLFSDSRVIFVDSFREFVYSPAKSAAGKGGMNMGIFNELTRLSAVTTFLGKSLVIALNPLTADADLIDMYREALGGSVTTVMIMNSPGSVSVSSRYAPDSITGDRKIVNLNINQRHLFEGVVPPDEKPMVYSEAWQTRGNAAPVRSNYMDVYSHYLDKPKG